MLIVSETEGKNVWLLCLIILAGIVVGGFIGEYLGQSPNMEWLRYGQTFGLSEPLLLDFNIITINFGFTMKFSISGIMGMALAIFIYIKL